MHWFYCTCPKFTTDLLAEEARRLGANDIKESPSGVSMRGSLELGYLLCLWSRIANRVLLRLAEFDANSPDALYDGTRSILWSDHIQPDDTLSVSASIIGSGSSKSEPPARKDESHQAAPKRRSSVHVGWTDGNFAALRVKDALVDQLRDRYGKRPRVDTNHPNLNIHVHIYSNKAQISIDLSGESLHRRGYRRIGSEASLKENVGAAMLLRAGWLSIAAGGGGFVDPMCGSGTLPIEAASIAGDTAPNLHREYFGFLGWRSHSSATWNRLVQEARDRRQEGQKKIGPISGYDSSRSNIEKAQLNAKAAKLDHLIHFECRDIQRAYPLSEHSPKGLVAINPPYGKRLASGNLSFLYSNIGSVLKRNFPGWRAALLTGDKELAKSTGLGADRINSLYNGGILCTLAHFAIKDQKKPREHPNAEMFENRIRKNLSRLRPWVEKRGISCYRIYDADMPEFSAAIDLFEGRWLHIQEYAAPPTVDPDKARDRFGIILEVAPQVLSLPRENVVAKTRRRQGEGEQYEKHGNSGTFYEVHEGGLSFLINLTDFLDTGLFLDMRDARSMLREESAGKKFLNLFSYTGTATVFAADGGAQTTVSVDYSNTYTSWARENMALNGFVSSNHHFIRAEARTWLAKSREKFDLIYLDPPTFSHSKGYNRNFQIQRDYGELIRLTLANLSNSGVLYFATNFKKFKFDPTSLRGLTFEDLTDETIPEDFQRHGHIHKLWRIQHI